MRGDAIFSRYYQYALGPEYRRVEYLQSSGEQWIDTGVSPAPNQEFELDGYWTNTTQYNNCWGVRNNSDAHAIEQFIELSPDTNRGIFFNYRSFEKISGFSRDVSQSRHRFVSHLHTGDQWLSVDGVKGTVYTDNGAFPDFGNLTYYAFARNQNGTANYFGNIRAYSMIFRTEGVPVRNLVSVVRVSDNKPGMYDLCGSICPLTGKPFYINSGTGADFAWGELQYPVQMPEYRRVAYLQSSGEQYIDTGINNVTDIEYDLQMMWTSNSQTSQYMGQGEGWFFGMFGGNKWRIPTHTTTMPIASVPNVSVNQWYDVHFSRTTTSSSIEVNESTYSKSGSKDASSLNAWLFGLSGEGNQSFKCWCKMKPCVIKVNSIVVRNYVPVVRLSDEKPGLIDLCGSICPLTGTSFYVNGGNGDDFTWGEL